MRYQEIISNKIHILGQNTLYCDVDMQFLKNLRPKTLQKRIRLARHPGYVIDWQKLFKLNYKEKLSSFFEFIKRLFRGEFYKGGWETRESSLSFVPNWKRRSYVHGAIWGGPTNLILEMCELLAKRVQNDLDRNVIAVWHDESHLNWYRCNYKVKLLPKYFSFSEFHNLFAKKKAIVISCDKEKAGIVRGN
jgi:hypothetical protein